MIMAIKGQRQAKKAIERSGKEIIDQFVETLGVVSALLATRVRQRYMTGGTSATKLKSRTGRLASSTKPIPVRILKNVIRSGVQFGTEYASAHIGPKGSSVTIKPKAGKKYLAIPLDAAKNPKGVSRGGPRDESLWGKTFVQKSKKGNLIIFGQSKYVKGKKKGQTRGNVVPLFVLKESIKIKRRIHPEDMLKWANRLITRKMSNVKITTQVAPV